MNNYIMDKETYNLTDQDHIKKDVLKCIQWHLIFFGSKL
ncbi:hypothetical protein SAMN05421797_10414 [Maribacter ulvicola]|uniref:Uncharacterized protein n=1 Tax=Maribacter ulvicola TaxID=228959 RepID=A0A1N6W9W5_9FLAO|nr:hypothetical protein SAMN05421797_10414 [Maribacter ulvicola]